MTGRQAAELLGLALDAEGAPWRTHPSSRTSRHIGGARCCCGLFRIDGGRTLPQSDPTTKYKWGNVNKYVVHLGAGSPLKFHGVPASDRTLPRAMGRGTHLCFPDAGMLHKFHVTLAYLRNSAATRALWQNQRCHKLLPSGLKLHQKNDDMEARLPNIKQHQCQRRFLFSFPKKHKAMRPLEAHPSAGAGASSIGDGRRRVNLVLNIATRPWRRRVNLVPRVDRGDDGSISFRGR